MFKIEASRLSLCRSQFIVRRTNTILGWKAKSCKVCETPVPVLVKRRRGATMPGALALLRPFQCLENAMAAVLERRFTVLAPIYSEDKILNLGIRHSKPYQ